MKLNHFQSGFSICMCFKRSCEVFLSTATSFTLEYLTNPSELLHPCGVTVKHPVFIKNKAANPSYNLQPVNVHVGCNFETALRKVNQTIGLG